MCRNGGKKPQLGRSYSKKNKKNYRRRAFGEKITPGSTATGARARLCSLRAGRAQDWAGMSAMERNCTLLMHYDKATPPNEEELRELLESKDPSKKVEAMKTLISLQLNGESMPKMLMVVIRFVVPCDDHKLKKLLLMYWEVIDKTGPDGKLLPEMILVWCACEAPTRAP